MTDSENSPGEKIPTITPSSRLTVSPWSRPTRSRIKNYLLLLVIVVIIGLLALVSFLLWREWANRFPSIEPGQYLGEILGLPSLNQGRALTIYAEKGASSDQILIAIAKEGWQPQSITLLAAATGTSKSDYYLPITLGSEDSKLKVTGERSSAQLYQGNIVDLKTGEHGRWYLRQMNPEIVPSTTSLDQDQDSEKKQNEELRLWLLLNDERAKVVSQIGQSESQVQSQKEEIERLSAFITEGERLKARSQEKYLAVKEELKKVQTELEAKQQQAKNLEQHFEVSQKVTAMGKLVSLSRESLEREQRWIDSLKVAAPANSSDEVEQAYAKAQKITEIKHNLQEEQDKIKRFSEVGGAVVND